MSELVYTSTTGTVLMSAVVLAAGGIATVEVAVTGAAYTRKRMLTLMGVASVWFAVLVISVAAVLAQFPRVQDMMGYGPRSVLRPSTPGTMIATAGLTFGVVFLAALVALVCTAVQEEQKFLAYVLAAALTLRFMAQLAASVCSTTLVERGPVWPPIVWDAKYEFFTNLANRFTAAFIVLSVIFFASRALHVVIFLTKWGYRKIRNHRRNAAASD